MVLGHFQPQPHRLRFVINPIFHYKHLAAGQLPPTLFFAPSHFPPNLTNTINVSKQQGHWRYCTVINNRFSSSAIPYVIRSTIGLLSDSYALVLHGVSIFFDRNS